jgi:hypothetical protein
MTIIEESTRGQALSLAMIIAHSSTTLQYAPNQKNDLTVIFANGCRTKATFFEGRQNSFSIVLNGRHFMASFGREYHYHLKLICCNFTT